MTIDTEPHTNESGFAPVSIAPVSIAPVSIAPVSIAPVIWQANRTPTATAEPVAQPGTAVAADPVIDRSVRAKLSKRDLAILTSQLAIMLRSGVDVVTALQSLARQSKRPEQAKVLQAIHADVVAGNSFSTALKPFAHIFGPSYIATVEAGEASGHMAEILGQLAILQRNALRLQNSIRTLMAYPLLLMAVSGVVLMALILFVLPKFDDVFRQFDTPLPTITYLLLGVSTELRSRFWFWGPMVVLLVGSLVAAAMSRSGRKFWELFLLRTYFVRDVTRSLLIGRICRLLGLMLNSGVPLLESLHIVKSSVQNSLYGRLLEEMEQSVLNGCGFGDILIESEFVPSSAAEMLATAERTGNIGSVTQMLGEHFEEDGAVKLRDIVTFLEPLITVVMGVLVAIIVLAVMLPMFDMATFAQG